MDGRIGLNGNYETITGAGRRLWRCVRARWYFGNITAMAKGGFSGSGGNPAGGFSGQGNYLGAALVGYITPDLGITGGVDWQEVVH